MAVKKQGETSYKETAFGIIPRTKLIPLEIEGIKKAWDFVLAQRKQGILPITPGFLKKLHQVGFGWIFPKTAGKFRTIEVVVSEHTPPKFYLVPEMIENFCKDTKVRMKHLPKIDEPNFLEELIKLMAWAHHRFLWIHPFQDYNGRIARLLNNIILLNLNLPPIELKVETKLGRKKYIEALQEADKDNFLLLGNIIKKAIEESVQKI